MQWPPGREGACGAPIPKTLLNLRTCTAVRAALQVVDVVPLVCRGCKHSNTRIEQLADGPHEICADCGRIVRHLSPSETHERESHALLCLILRKLAEIEAQLHSPLTARRLHWRYCARCGERVTNANVGGYEGRSALTGRLYCLACADALEDPQ